MAEADPNNEGQALNLITFDKEKGKWNLTRTIFFLHAGLFFNDSFKSYIGFQVSAEAISLLQSDELVNQKVCVVAVAGKYRTGKSFLLNRILLDK